MPYNPLSELHLTRQKFAIGKGTIDVNVKNRNKNERCGLNTLKIFRNF